MRFRKRPVVIEAVQFDGTISQGLKVPGLCVNMNCNAHTARPHVHTLEGAMFADAGDWIIKGVKGEFYPCKPDIFAATYEPVNDEVTA